MNRSWKVLLENELDTQNDTLVSHTMTEEEYNEVFDIGYGGTNGCSFTAWGEKYVYFPLCYDGAEWVGSAPRNPSDEKLYHQGGG